MNERFKLARIMTCRQTNGLEQRIASHPDYFYSLATEQATQTSQHINTFQRELAVSLALSLMMERSVDMRRGYDMGVSAIRFVAATGKLAGLEEYDFESQPVMGFGTINPFVDDNRRAGEAFARSHPATDRLACRFAGTMDDVSDQLLAYDVARTAFSVSELSVAALAGRPCLLSKETPS